MKHVSNETKHELNFNIFSLNSQPAEGFNRTTGVTFYVSHNEISEEQV